MGVRCGKLLSGFLSLVFLSSSDSLIGCCFAFDLRPSCASVAGVCLIDAYDGEDDYDAQLMWKLDRYCLRDVGRQATSLLRLEHNDQGIRTRRSRTTHPSASLVFTHSFGFGIHHSHPRSRTPLFLDTTTLQRDLCTGPDFLFLSSLILIFCGMTTFHAHHRRSFPSPRGGETSEDVVVS